MNQSKVHYARHKVKNMSSVQKWNLRCNQIHRVGSGIKEGRVSVPSEAIKPTVGFVPQAKLFAVVPIHFLKCLPEPIGRRVKSTRWNFSGLIFL